MVKIPKSICYWASVNAKSKNHIPRYFGGLMAYLGPQVHANWRDPPKWPPIFVQPPQVCPICEDLTIKCIKS